MNDQPHIVAILGCGWVSDLQIQGGFLQLPESFRVVACCDNDVNRTAELAKKYGVARGGSCVEEIISAREIHTVSICTPPSTHFQRIKLCVQAGKHVTRENPLVQSLALVDEVAAIECSSAGQLMPIFQHRFGAGLSKSSRVIASGIAGKLLAPCRSASLSFQGAHRSHFFRSPEPAQNCLSEAFTKHTIRYGKVRDFDDVAEGPQAEALEVPTCGYWRWKGYFGKSSYPI